MYRPKTRLYILFLLCSLLCIQFHSDGKSLPDSGTLRLEVFAYTSLSLGLNYCGTHVCDNKLQLAFTP